MLVNIIQNTISSFRSALAAASVITTNLKMWLGFETSSIDGDKQITPDKSGNNNVGELFTGKALDFDGVTEEVDISGFQMSGAIATFAFWIYPRDTTYQFIMDNKLASGNTDRTILALYQTGSESQKFGFFNYGFKQFGTPTQNQWQRVVFRVNATTVECYVDGVKSGSTLALTSSIDLSASVTANIASKSGSTSASNLDAKLSDFQIYNAYWSTDDIAYDYANPQNLVTDRSGTSIEVTNLKAYWAMSEGAGSLTYDSSGEGNNGTINGATYEPNQPRIPQLGMMNWSKGSNLIFYSEEFDNSAWSKAGSTITPNYANSPYGNLNASKIVISSQDVERLKQVVLSGVSITGDTYTGSIWVKGEGVNVGKNVRFRIKRGSSGTLVDSIVNHTLTSSWVKLSATITGLTSNTGVAFTFDGANGYADEFLIWGAQLEESSSAGAYRLTDGAATLNSTVIPNPTIPTQDIFGNAVRDRLNSFNLDGTGYAEVADDTDLDFGTGDFTLECWAKYDFLNQGSGFNVLVSNGSISTSGGSGFSLASKSSSFSIRLNAGSAQTVDFGSGLTQGQWYHIVVTRSGTTLKTYLDKSDTSNTILSVDVDTSLPVRIGRDTNSNRFYQNLISDVRLYDRALTSNEVQNNYNAGLSAHTN